ncbi:MAG: hypothetical protein EP301_04265 [Gammaproteobacteria bacterium]|nr:MAG: hypothetical protein EP301_04265 [Gammaproteobacteria bacterium]
MQSGEDHQPADSDHGSNHHLALLIGLAYEEKADGHHEDGNMTGVEYIYHLNHHWGLGAAVEMEVFGDDHERNGILAVPVSHFRGNWRFFAGPGVELRRDDETEFMFRLGAGYEFHLSKRLTLSPEAMVDFVENGTNVYVVSLAFGLSL